MTNTETKKKEPINFTSLIISLVALVLGILLLFNGDEDFFNLLRYIISGALLITGFFKFLVYIFQKNKYNLPFSDCISAIFFIGLAIFVFAFSDIIKITIQVIAGTLIMFNGIQRLILGLIIKSIDKEGSKVFTGVSILMIILGIIILTGKFFNLIVVFLIIYAVSEISGYIYYTSQKKDYSEVLNKKVPKSMKDKEAKEAVIEENNDLTE